MGFVRHRQSQRAWDDVAPAAYDDPSLEGVERHDLIGSLDEVPNYHVRYFHVEPGKQTRREQHPHDHDQENRDPWSPRAQHESRRLRPHGRKAAGRGCCHCRTGLSHRSSAALRPVVSLPDRSLAA